MINLNNSFIAQSFFEKRFFEWSINLAIVTEPNYVKNSWFSDNSNKVAVVVDRRSKALCKLICSGEGFVAVMFQEILILACYISPNMLLNEFSCILDRLGKPYLLLGDFNSNLKIWGSHHNSSRGKRLFDLISSLDLRLANDKRIPTCVRAQGSSVVDLIWFSSSMANRICQCTVLDSPDFDSYSDHRYIRFKILFSATVLTESILFHRRWSREKFNVDKFRGALLARIWSESEINTTSVDAFANLLEETITRACDFAAPRVKKSKRMVYWWNADIKRKREIYTRARRHYYRVKKRSSSSCMEINEAKNQMNVLRRKFRNSIYEAKKTSWQELICDLNYDPWGKGYKIVMQKMRAQSPLDLTLMSPDKVNEILDSLFPYNSCVNNRLGLNPDLNFHRFCLDEDISVDDVRSALRGNKKKNKNVAPGPDGFTRFILGCFPDEFIEVIAALYQRCLIEGKFPKNWKLARLVLIPKPDSYISGKFRPICLVRLARRLSVLFL